MKNYNPFKMWGSYVIPILAIFGYLHEAFTWGTFCPKLDFVVSQTGTLFCEGHVNSQLGLFGLWLNPLTWYLVVIVGGFLFGWGIHSLLRFVRR